MGMVYDESNNESTIKDKWGRRLYNGFVWFIIYDNPYSLCCLKNKVSNKKRKVAALHVDEEANEGASAAAAAELLAAETLPATQVDANSHLPIATRVQRAKDDFNNLYI